MALLINLHRNPVSIYFSSVSIRLHLLQCAIFLLLFKRHLFIFLHLYYVCYLVVWVYLGVALYSWKPFAISYTLCITSQCFGIITSFLTFYCFVNEWSSYWRVYPAAISLLISSAIHPFYISSNIPIFLRNLIIFSTSQSFPSSVFMWSWILHSFLLSLHRGSLVPNVLLSFSSFWMLVGSYFFTSNVRQLV